MDAQPHLSTHSSVEYPPPPGYHEKPKKKTMNSHDTRVLPVSTSRNRDMIDQDTRLSEPIQLRGSEFQDSGFLLLKIDLGFHQLEILEK